MLKYIKKYQNTVIDRTQRRTQGEFGGSNTNPLHTKKN